MLLDTKLFWNAGCQFNVIFKSIRRHFWKCFMSLSSQHAIPSSLVPWQFSSGRSFFGKKIQIFLNNFIFQRVWSGICWVLGRNSLILVDWQVFMGSCDFRFPEAMTLSDMEVPQKATSRDSCFYLSLLESPSYNHLYSATKLLDLWELTKPLCAARTCQPIGDYLPCFTELHIKVWEICRHHNSIQVKPTEWLADDLWIAIFRSMRLLDNRQIWSDSEMIYPSWLVSCLCHIKRY